jgi:hypothetical protein
MKFLGSQRFLILYSGLVTLAFSVTVLCGFVAQSKRGTFEQIDVQRINLVEPDGTIRMVISDKAQFPGSYIKGKEIPRPDRKSTGIIFIDDEGSEIGGLTFRGSKDNDGKVHSNGHLSFDQYMQDQIFAIDAGEDAGAHYSALTISDRPDYPITEEFDVAQKIRALPPDQQSSAWQKFYEAHPGYHPRIVFGRSVDKSSVLRMKDLDGHDRLVIQVTADGTPVIEFLDKDGKVIGRLPK